MALGKMTRFKAKKNKLYKGVKTVKQQVDNNRTLQTVKRYINRRAETKYWDQAASGVSLTSGTPIISAQGLFNGITTGQGDFGNRIGDQIEAMKVEFRWLLHTLPLDANNVAAIAVRFIMFQWHIETAPTIGDVVQYSNITSPLTVDSKKARQYTIISDRIYRGTIDHNAQVSIIIKRKIPRKRIAFSAGGTVPLKNDIFYIIMPQYIAGLSPQYDAHSRVTYKDY